MDIENKLTQINTFIGGMNTDVSDALLKTDQYRFATNLRLVTSEDNNSGELHMIRGGVDRGHAGSISGSGCDIVVAATQIRNIGVIIGKDNGTGDWCVVKFECDGKLPDIISSDTPLLNYQKVFGPCADHLPEDTKLSLVTRYEDEDNIKLYIADGEHPIMLVNLAKDYGDGDINKIISYPKAIFKKPIFCGLTSGSLKSGVVEYSYQFFNEGGNYTEISPSTKLISIHKGNADNASGYPKDTITDRGVSLKFDLSDSGSFDSLRIYRIMYTEAGQLPTIEVIYENKLPENTEFNFIDNGQKAITTLTLEEYNSITGIHIIPKTIESKDDYMFASNIKTDDRLDLYDAIRNWDSRAFQCNLDGYYRIKNSTGNIVQVKYQNGDWNVPNLDDDCINPDYNEYKYIWNSSSNLMYYGGVGPNVSWKFVKTSVDGDSTLAKTDVTYGEHGSSANSISYRTSGKKFNSSSVEGRYISLANSLNSTSSTIQTVNIDLTDYVETASGGEIRNYGNEKVTYSLKSLRRGEIYRYGIVLYSDKGETTNVKWICDIKVPEMYIDNFNTFISHHNGMELEVYPLGIEFTVDISSILSDSTIIHDGVDIIGYEIVRCPRTEADMKTISQGVLSRPCAKFIDPGSSSSQKIYPLTPTGWLSTCGYWAGGYLLTNYSQYDASQQEDVDKIQGWLMTNNYFNPSQIATGSSLSDGYPTRLIGNARIEALSSQHGTVEGTASVIVYFEEDTSIVDAQELFDVANVLYYRPVNRINIPLCQMRITNTSVGSIATLDKNDPANNPGISYGDSNNPVINVLTGLTVNAKLDNCNASFVLPSSFNSISTANLRIYISSNSYFDTDADQLSSDSDGFFGNYSVYQFISPEVSYLKDSMRDLITDNVNVTPQLYLFGTTCNTQAEYVSEGVFWADRTSGNRWPIGNDDDHKEGWIYRMPNPMGVNPGGSDYNGTPDWDDRAEGQKEKNGTPPNPNMVKGLFMYPGNRYTKLPLNGSYGQPGINGAANVNNETKNGPLSPMVYKNIICRLPGMYNYMTTYTYYYEGTSNFGDLVGSKKKDGFYDDVLRLQFNVSHQYIKLYEASNYVVRNNNLFNPFNKISHCRFSNNSITATKLDSAAETSTQINHNLIVASRVAFPDTLSWDDFNDLTSDATLNFRVTYSDKTTPIGTDSYNNWVSSGMYGIGFNEVPPSKANMSYGKSTIIDRYYSGLGGVNGPAGSCAILKLDVEPTDQLSSTSCTDRIYKSSVFDLQTNQANIGYDYPNGTHLIQNVDLYTDTNDHITRWVYRESALGTYLVNITRNVTPYGGNDFAHRQTNTYNSYGDYFEFDAQGQSVSHVFNGDCFILPFEYTSLHKMSSAAKYSRSVRTANITYAIPVETNINIAYEHGYPFSKNGSKPLILELPSDVNGQFILDTPQYVYNGIYSTNTLSKLFAAEEDFDRISSQQNFDYRTYHSNPKINNEALDSWIKYMPANHIDVDTRFGPITGLRTFGNRLVYWQSGATGIFSVNERVLITDSSNLPLILGTGGILTRYDYVSQLNGMHIDQYADTQSNTTLYWFDYDKHELCAMGHDGLVIVLSKTKNVLNYLNQLANKEKLVDKPTLVYDTEFNEMMAYVANDNNIKPHCLDENPDDVPISLIYSENQSVFTGVYTIPIYERCVFTNNLYIVGTGLARNAVSILWNKQSENDNPTFDGDTYLYPYIKYVTNESSTITKTFDTFKFGGRFWEGNQSSESISGRPPIVNSGNISLSDLQFEFFTPLKQHGVLSGKNLDNIEYDFRGAIPRNGLTAEHDVLFGDRLRGKTMQCEMYSQSSDYDFSLQYIATKYRVSWT